MALDAPLPPAAETGPPASAAAATADGAGGLPPRGHRVKRRRRRLPWVLAGVVVVLLGTGGTVAAQRIDRPLARPSIHPDPAVALSATGVLPSLPWPTVGQAAVAVPSIGYATRSGPEASVPVASLTKITTALVVLHDHPVPAGADGPPITVTTGDVAEYDNELHNDESSVPIEVGETLTEREMLEALLTQSANDVAYSLAVWDAGTLPAFVDKMNALAAELGATGTHYVDASGYDPHSVSTASDVLLFSAAGMAIPTFAEVVGMTTVTLPLVGTIPNIVTEVDLHEALGLKSGYTSKAGACMVLAGQRSIGGRQVLVLTAVLGQPTPPPVQPKPTTTTTTAPRPAPPPPVTGSTTTPPPTAGGGPPPSPPTPPTTTTTTPLDDLTIPDPFKYTRPVVDRLLSAAVAGVVPVTVATAGELLGSVSSTWGGVAHPAPVVAATGAWLAAWPGQLVRSSLRFVGVSAGSAEGTKVGTALFALGTEFTAVPLRLSTSVPEPSWWWRLLHTH